MSEPAVIEIIEETGLVIEVVDLGPQGPAAEPLSSAGLLAALAMATGDDRVALADEVARMIAGALPPLPSLPLPTGARIAAIGDSQIAFNNLQSGSASAEGVSRNALGFIQQVAARDPRFRFDNWYDPSDPTGRNIAGGNQGVFGDHLGKSPAGQTDLGGIVGRLPAVLARRPDILIIQGGTNTISTGQENDASHVIAKLNLALALARRAAIWTILVTVYPRSGWANGGDPVRQDILTEVNAWIREQSGRDGVMAILDADQGLAPDGVIQTGLYQSDLVHLNVPGAQKVGQLLLPIVQSSVAAGSVFNQAPAVDNLWPLDRGNMVGSTGTKTGAGVSGDVATGFTLALDRNASAVVGSKQVISGAIEAQAIDITPANLTSAAYGGVLLTAPQITAPPIVAGDWVQAFLHIETDGVAAFSLARLQLAVRQSATVRVRSYGMFASSGNFNVTALPAQSCWIVTDPLRVPSDMTFDRLFASLEIYFDKSAPPFQIRISRPIIRKVPDPRVGWGY